MEVPAIAQDDDEAGAGLDAVDEPVSPAPVGAQALVCPLKRLAGEGVLLHFLEGAGQPGLRLSSSLRKSLAAEALNSSW